MYVYVNKKKVLKKESPKIQVLRVACGRGKMNTELVDLSSRELHHVLLQTPGDPHSFLRYPNSLQPGQQLIKCI